MGHFVIGVIGLGVIVGAVGMVLGDMVVTVYKHMKK